MAKRDQLKAELLARFGTEEAMGIIYEEDEYAHLPDGFGEMGRCTNIAHFVISRLGRGDIYGFLIEDNPVASRIINIAGGHDFAVVDDLIVDPWISLYTGEEQQVIYDLCCRDDQSKITEIYGQPANWDWMEPAASAFCLARGLAIPADKQRQIITNEEIVNAGRQDLSPNT